VPSEAARSEAARLVAAVPQVRGVQNRLAVDPTLAAPAGGGRSLGENLDDRGLEVSVRLALSLHTGLAGSDIQVAAFRREVTLAGELAHPGQRQIALALAQAVTGVEDVVDRLRVRNQAPTGADAGQAAPDRLAAVRQALADNLNLAGYDLRCQASAETLHLTGQVQTGAERDLAGLLAREAWQGPVENLLQIVPKRDKMVEKTKDKGGTLP
jgi:osmotically-inducible protein OsmY